jgi:hypothetical protein
MLAIEWRLGGTKPGFPARGPKHAGLVACLPAVAGWCVGLALALVIGVVP